MQTKYWMLLQIIIFTVFYTMHTAHYIYLYSIHVDTDDLYIAVLFYFYTWITAYTQSEL